MRPFPTLQGLPFSFFSLQLRQGSLKLGLAAIRKNKKTTKKLEFQPNTSEEKHCHAFVPETPKMGLAPEADAAGGMGSMQLFNTSKKQKEKLTARKSGEGQS